MVSSSRGLMFGAALVLACSAAPSSVPAPPAPPPQPPAAEDALANARRLAKAAHGIRPPALPNATKEDALAWLKGDLAAWLVLRRAACVEAEAEYLSAARRAPAEKTTALLEAADVWLEFADEFAVAAKGGASYITSNAALRAPLEKAVLEAAEPLLERAEKLLQECAGGASSCQTRLAAVQRMKPRKEAPPAPDPDQDWRFLRLSTPARKPLTPSSPRPCSYRGSLALDHGRAYADREGSEAALSITDAELELELPERRAGRFHVKVSWPILAQAWLDASALPLATKRRLAVKEPHLWLAPGARVFAWKGQKAGGATLGRPLEGQKIERAFESDLPCRDLTLPRELPEDPREGYIRDRVGLFAEKGGTEIMRYELGFELSVHVLARDGEWTRVRGHVSDFTLNAAPYLPFDFEAWTDAAVSDQSELGMIGIYNPPEVQPSHRAGAALELFAAPARDARLLGRAAAGAPFRTGRSRDGYVAVKFKGVGGANENSEFWVQETALSQQASRW